MKTKVLALVHGEWASHTVRVLEIAKALRETGNYKIKFSGTGEYMEKMVGPAGFDWVDTPTLPKEQIYNVITTKLVPRVFTNEDAIKYYGVEFALLRKHSPDIILRDQFRELAGVAAKEQGVYDVFVQGANCSHYHYWDFRPSTFPKLLGAFIPSWAIRPFGKTLIKLGRDKVYQPIRNVVLGTNLPVNNDAPEGYEADLVLFPDSERLFPFPGKKDFYKHIGPILPEGDVSPPEWLDDFKKDFRKKILITNGSTILDDKTEMFVDAFSDLEFAVAFDTAGDKYVPWDFYGRNKFDINSVLPYADVFITHGGIGSTYFGLKNGVPMLVIPNHFEQETNGSQVRKAGVGLSLMKRDLSSQNIRRDIETIVSDETFKKNALEFADSLRGQNSLELAVKYISEGYEKFKE